LRIIRNKVIRCGTIRYGIVFSEIVYKRIIRNGIIHYLTVRDRPSRDHLGRWVRVRGRLFRPRVLG
jgi:hypothetical protein